MAFKSPRRRAVTTSASSRVCSRRIRCSKARLTGDRRHSRTLNTPVVSSDTSSTQTDAREGFVVRCMRGGLLSVDALPNGVTAWQVLEPVARELGGVAVSRVSLAAPEGTSLVDAVFADRYGCLNVTVMSLPGARLSGAESDSTWRAEGPAGSTTVANPFATATGRRSALVATVADVVPSLDVAHVSELVVIDGADFSGLSLSDRIAYKVVSLADLGAALHARHDFAINAGILDGVGIETIARRLREHASSESAALGGYNVSSFPEPAAQGLPGYTVPLDQRGPDRARAADWGGAGGFTPPRAAAYAFPSQQPIPARKRMRINASLVVALVLCGIAVWLMYYGGLPHVVDGLSGAVGGIQGRYTQEIQSAEAATDMPVSKAQAYAALQSEQGEVASAVEAPGSPEVTREGEYTKFSWHYRPAGGGDAVATVTYDANGILRGVEAGR